MIGPPSVTCMNSQQQHQRSEASVKPTKICSIQPFNHYSELRGDMRYLEVVQVKGEDRNGRWWGGGDCR